MTSKLSLEHTNKLFRYMKDGSSVEEFLYRFDLSRKELDGVLMACRIYGKEIDIIKQDDKEVFERIPVKKYSLKKMSPLDGKMIHNQICVVSDTHFGSIHNQLHLLNRVYEECDKRGIKIVLHIGDLVDGNYPNRPENPRQQFLHGFDEQARYVCDMYPKVDGITTYYILGSHDETHYKNGQSTLSEWIPRCRQDMKYVGQDCGEFNLDGVKIFMDHPGGGSAASLSYKPQKRIELLESQHKPKILLIGHYHKSYAFSYRNVQCVLVPALCDKTQFQQKQGLSNALGAYFLDIYSDKKGNIQYFTPEEIIFKKEDIWDEIGKDKNKVKQLVIKKDNNSK
ncbi:MAG: metallophosphoesterase family protein [Bacilli bacterium]|nr:metallophosphoesterase family protein [Bacilli bacterium]